MANPTQNEFYINGVQVLTQIDGTGVIINSTSIDSLGYTTGASATTWTDTHSTIFNARSLKNNINPQILAVEKALLLVNNATTPTASIGIEADNSGGIGTYFGMNLFNNNDTDFTVTSSMPYQGSVVFNQEGSGADTTTTSIKQGTITLNDVDIPITTTFTPTTLTSGASSMTWTDIIAGSGSVGTLNSVLANGNTATDQSIIMNASPPDGRTSTLENYRLYMNQGDSVAEYRGDFLQITSNLTSEQTTLEPASLTFTATDTITLNTSGLTTTVDLTLDVGNDLILSGANITATTAGGFTAEYLRVKINGIYYKLQLLAD
jgi:hypothetical protein